MRSYTTLLSKIRAPTLLCQKFTKRYFSASVTLNSNEEIMESLDKDWDSILQSEKTESEARYAAQLTKIQLKRADALADAIMDMNKMEFTYTMNRHATYIDEKCLGIQENTIRQDWPTPENISETNLYINETDSYKQEAEKLESLFLNAEFFEKLGMPISVGGGTSGGPEAVEGSAAVEEEKVVEERKS